MLRIASWTRCSASRRLTDDESPSGRRNPVPGAGGRVRKMSSDNGDSTVLSGAQQRRGLAHSTLSGLFWMAMGAGAQGFFQLLVMVVLARLLTPADFGIVSATMVVVGFSTIFSQLGVGPAVVQHPELGTVHLRTGFTLSALFGMGMTFLIWAITPEIAAFFRMEDLVPVVRVMATVFTLQGVSVVS